MFAYIYCNKGLIPNIYLYPYLLLQINKKKIVAQWKIRKPLEQASHKEGYPNGWYAKAQPKEFSRCKRKLKYIFWPPRSQHEDRHYLHSAGFHREQKTWARKSPVKEQRQRPDSAQRCPKELRDSYWNVLRRWFLSQGDEMLQQWVWSFLPVFKGGSGGHRKVRQKAYWACLETSPRGLLTNPWIWCLS